MSGRRFSIADRNNKYEQRLKKEGIDPRVKVVKETSVPITGFVENVDVDGVFYRFMAPTAGTASNLKVTIEYLENQAFLEIVHLSKLNEVLSHTPIVVTQGINEVHDSIRLQGGERVVLSIKNGVPSGIWTAFKWQGAGN